MMSSATAFYTQVMRLLRASPLFGGLVVLSGVVLAFGPMLFWQFCRLFIDSAYGARGIGTITSDLTHAATMLIVLMVCIAFAGYFLQQSSGLSRRIIATIALFGIVLTHVIALMPIIRGFVLLLIVVAIGSTTISRMALSQRLRTVIQGTLLFLLVALALTTWRDLLVMMTTRSITVGNMVEYSGVVLMLSGAVAVVATKRR